MWKKAALDLQLPLITEFSVCLDVDKENVKYLLKELSAFRCWVDSNYEDGDLRIGINKGVDILSEKLISLFAVRPDIELSIG